MRLRVSRLVYQGGKHVKMKEIDALSSTKRVYGEIWYIMLTLDMFLLAAEDTLIIIPIVGLLLLPLRFIQLVSNQFQTLQPLDARCFALSKCKGVIPNCKQPWNLELCWEKTQCERNRRELTNLLNTCFWQRNEAENFNPKTHKDISSPSTQNPDASPAQKQNSARLHMETIAIKSFAYCKCKFRRVLPMWGPGMHVQFSLNFQAKSQAKEVVNASHFESTPNITKHHPNTKTYHPNIAHYHPKIRPPKPNTHWGKVGQSPGAFASRVCVSVLRLRPSAAACESTFPERFGQRSTDSTVDFPTWHLTSQNSHVTWFRSDACRC